jgi:hypothetical protein
MPSGNLTSDTLPTPIPYVYNLDQDNLHGRSLRFLSVHTASFYPHGNFHAPLFSTMQPYQDYFGSVKFANQWIEAAFHQDATTSLVRGNAYFGDYTWAGRGQAIQIASAVLSMGLFVLRQLEVAVVQCWAGCMQESCQYDAVGALDQAVAYYVGALQGPDGNGQGNLMYQLADTYCTLYKTCGVNGDAAQGTSRVNTVIMDLFNVMKEELLQKDCTKAKSAKEKIVTAFYIPLIQATLRYAYITATEESPSGESEAAGATFAAAVVPVLHHCRPADATTVFDNTQTGQNGSCEFDKVKAALERNYACLRITCEDVGGLYDAKRKKYFPGAEPCGWVDDHHEDQKKHRIIGFTLTGCFVAMLLLYIRRRRRSQVDMSWDDDDDDEDGSDASSAESVT